MERVPGYLRLVGLVFLLAMAPLADALSPAAVQGDASSAEIPNQAAQRMKRLTRIALSMSSHRSVS